METRRKIIIFLLRVSMGWMMFYAGITKILDPAWTSKKYIISAKTFSVFYAQLTSANILPTVDFLNKWGLTLIGISLILGFLVKFSSLFGALLMALYYFPILDFPYVGPVNSYIVDQHVIFFLVFIFLFLFNAGRSFGFDSYRISKR